MNSSRSKQKLVGAKANARLHRMEKRTAKLGN
jgi:hypothetical protein